MFRRNAAVAGAVMGAMVGFTNLPGDWLENLAKKNRQWLAKKTSSFLKAIENGESGKKCVWPSGVEVGLPE